MADLKPCPFCGGEAKVDKYTSGKFKKLTAFYIECRVCKIRTPLELEKGKAIEAWNRRTKVEVNFYDKEETYPNCTVQVLTNTVTGDVSVGWWKNGGNEDA